MRGFHKEEHSIRTILPIEVRHKIVALALSGGTQVRTLMPTILDFFGEDERNIEEIERYWPGVFRYPYPKEVWLKAASCSAILKRLFKEECFVLSCYKEGYSRLRSFIQKDTSYVHTTLFSDCPLVSSESRLLLIRLLIEDRNFITLEHIKSFIDYHNKRPSQQSESLTHMLLFFKMADFSVEEQRDLCTIWPDAALYCDPDRQKEASICGLGKTLVLAATMPEGNLEMIIRDAVRRNIPCQDIINWQEPDGETPIMRAVLSPSPENVHYLLTLGADPRLKNRAGFSAIDNARFVHSYLPTELPPITEILSAWIEKAKQLE